MTLDIFNKNKDIHYFHVESGKLLNKVEALYPRKINNQAFSDYLANGLFYMRRAGTYRPVAGLFPIPGRSRWRQNLHSIEFIESIWYKKLQFNARIERLDEIAKRYVSGLKGRTIVVELSGGLDTSLIIEFLKAQEAKIVLIGFYLDEYEFRTESVVQQHYIKNTNDYELIDYRTCPAFGHLLETPIHPFPVADSLYHYRGQVIMQAARNSGSNLILNGMAGDNLLGHSFIDIPSNSVPLGYDPWSMIDSWSSDFIYKDNGITEISPFALHSVIRTLVSLRINEAEDTMKLWARRKFTNKLPRELSRYAYKANHNSWIAEGLMIAEDDIKELLRAARNFLSDAYLNANKFLKAARTYNHISNHEQQDFLMKLSFLVWIYGYIREGYLV